MDVQGFQGSLSSFRTNKLENSGPSLKDKGKSVLRGPQTPWFCYRDDLYRIVLLWQGLYSKKFELRFKMHLFIQLSVCSYCVAGAELAYGNVGVNASWTFPWGTQWGRQAFTYNEMCPQCDQCWTEGVAVGLRGSGWE